MSVIDKNFVFFLVCLVTSWFLLNEGGNFFLDFEEAVPYNEFRLSEFDANR